MRSPLRMMWTIASPPGQRNGRASVSVSGGGTFYVCPVAAEQSPRIVDRYGKGLRGTSGVFDAPLVPRVAHERSPHDTNGGGRRRRDSTAVAYDDRRMSIFAGFDHVQVCCPPGGEDVARAFYGGVLGLTEVPKPDELAGRGGCWFQVGAGQGLHVGVLDPFAPSTKGHPALRVVDVPTLEALVQRVSDGGVDVEWADVPVADARCKLHDPFGNLVELLVGTTG